MPSRNLDDLTPEMKAKALELQRICRERFGLAIIFTCTARTIQEQVAYYAQGRQPLEEVNALRKVAKLAPITSVENLRRVTWTLKSKHLVNYDDADPSNDKARAFDIAIVDHKGKAVWDVKADVNADNVSDYEQVARLGEELGLRAGARFSKPDFPHFETKEVS